MPLAIFDLDGTLVDQRSAAHEWAHAFAEKWSAADATESIASALTGPRPTIIADAVGRILK